MFWFSKRNQQSSIAVRRIDQVVRLESYGPLQVQVMVDCLGAVCPRPQLLTMRALDHMNDGEVLELLVDNPASAEAIPAMAMGLGSTHLVTMRNEGSWRIYLRKGFGDDGH